MNQDVTVRMFPYREGYFHGSGNKKPRKNRRKTEIMNSDKKEENEKKM